ncbi:MAG: hypothetical protein NW237_05160 [Cyanobacteriota bacterium]|nr:hypothetical protein [Cyanobacteriota bacterium]
MLLSSAPIAEAQVVGPRGTTATGRRAVFTNPEGGTTAVGGGQVTGVKDCTVQGIGGVKTSGQGSASYGGAASSNGDDCTNVDVTTTGTASYQDGQYSGSNTTTVNGKTYSTTTQDGSTTVTNPEGESETYTRNRLFR